MMNLESIFIQPEARILSLNSFMLVLCQVVFIVSIGLTLGATILSLVYSFMASRHKEGYVLRFSHDVMNVLYVNKWAAFGLGIISLASIVLLRGSYLYGANTTAFSYLVISFVVTAFGYSFAGSYFAFNRVNQLREKMHVQGEDEGSNASGWIAVTLIASGLFFYVAGEEIAANESLWSKMTNFYVVFLTSVLWAKYFLVLTLALAISGIAVLFRFFNDQSIQLDDEYAVVVKKRAIRIALSFILLLPLFAIWEIYMQPEYRISYASVLWKLLALCGIFGVTHMLWAIQKGSKTRFDKVALPLIILVVLSYAIADDASFRYGARSHIAKIELADYARMSEHGHGSHKVHAEEGGDKATSETESLTTEHGKE
jgi:hypothetical protein